MSGERSAGVRRLAGRLDVLLGFVGVLLLGAAMSYLAPELDARLLDAEFALNRQWFPQPVRDDVVVVGINEAFLDQIDVPLALSHQYLADFLVGVSASGPAVIALDLVLPEKRFDKLALTSNPQFDFHRTLLSGLMQAQQHTKLVLAKVWDHTRGHYFDIQIDYAQMLSMQDPQVQSTASALFCADDEGRRTRRYPGPEWNCQPDHTAFTLSSEMGAAMGVRQPWSGLINYQLGGELSYIPLQEVLALVGAGNAARLAELFRGKAVILGTVQDDIDLVDLPVPLAAWLPGRSRVPGVLVHAQTVRTMLNRGFITPMPPSLVWALSLCCVLFWFHRSVWRKALLLLSLSVCLLLAGNVLLRQGYWLPPAGMLLTGWTALVARSAWQAWRNYAERQRLSRGFAGYVSKEVMDEIIAGGADTRKENRKLPVCVLFSDIRSFTTLSEHLDAEQVVELLNRYFGRMTKMVHKHHGTVDKFIGDGMMAFFGAPNSIPNPEKAALEAACDMLDELRELNDELRAEGAEPFEIGIGIHCGLAVIGYIGSDDRHEYTAIGDTVNIASRLEGLSKPLGYSIICSEAVAAKLHHPVVLASLGQHPLKGHTAVPVYGWRPEFGPIFIADEAGDGAPEAPRALPVASA